MIIGYIALLIRIIMLGMERIALKFLDEYNSIVVGSLFFLVATIFLLPILIFIPFSAFLTIKPITILLGLLSSLIYSFGFFAYVKALQEGDASLVAPLYNSSLLWLLFMGFFFLGEDVTVIRSIGVVTMCVGLLFLYPGSLMGKLKAIRNSRASLYMIIGSLFIASGRMIDTKIIMSLDERIYAVFTNFFIGLFLFIPVIYQRNLHEIFKIIHKKKKIIISAGILNGWSYLFLLVAISYLQVTVAEPASLLSVFITAVSAKVILKEKVEQRIPGMLLMFISSLMLFL